MVEYKTRKDELESSLARVDLSERMSKVGIATLPSQVARTASTGVQRPPPPPASARAEPGWRNSSGAALASSGTMPLASSNGAPAQSLSSSAQLQTPGASPGFALPAIPPPEELSKGDALRAGNELVQRAQAEDAARRYQNALVAYRRGCDYLLRTMSEETNPESKSRVGDRVRSYLARAEQLNLLLTQQQLSNPLVQQQTCAYCKELIPITEDYKLAEEKSYHVRCFSLTIGLVREERRSFLMTTGELVLKVALSRKVFSVGERFEFELWLTNPTSKAVKNCYCYLLCTETTMVNINQNGDRKPRSKATKFGKKRIFGPPGDRDIFPLEHGATSIKEFFTVPDGIMASEPAGLTSMFVREYEFVVGAKLGAPLTSNVKVLFPVIVEKPRGS